ncbi:MAG: hypothetical protein BIFFINMI_00344 [Phycisphaerae bacterium]|nr:hypothetical protein [Phycisphaerae bacterium]
MLILAESGETLRLFAEHPWWVGLGLLGELVFMARFVVQWVASERAKRSHVPVVFWYLSLLGTLIVLIYAVWRRDPVFILGQSLPVVIYFRNLVLIYRHQEVEPAQATAAPPRGGQAS